MKVLVIFTAQYHGIGVWIWCREIREMDSNRLIATSQIVASRAFNPFFEKVSK